MQNTINAVMVCALVFFILQLISVVESYLKEYYYSETKLDKEAMKDRNSYLEYLVYNPQCDFFWSNHLFDQDHSRW